MKNTQTSNTDHFFKLDECVDILTRTRNKCAASIGDGHYAEFDLYNVVDINQYHPSTFVIPNEMVRNLVVPGMLIKVYADWCDSVSLDERFWVRVTDITELVTGEKIVYGTAENDTTYVPFGSYLGPIRLSNICDVDLQEFVQSQQLDGALAENHQ